MANTTPTEQPEDKDLQDHRFGMTAAKQQEQADAGERPEHENEPEPHAGGKA